MPTCQDSPLLPCFSLIPPNKEETFHQTEQMKGKHPIALLMMLFDKLFNKLNEAKLGDCSLGMVRWESNAKGGFTVISS